MTAVRGQYENSLTLRKLGLVCIKSLEERKQYTYEITLYDKARFVNIPENFQVLECSNLICFTLS